MSCLMKAKKSDLLSLCEELDITVPPNTKVAKLVKLIKESEDFDEDFAKSRLEVYEKERREEVAREEKQREFELKQREIELEKEKQKQEKEFEIAEKEKQRQFELEKQRQEKEFELRRLEITSRSNDDRENPTESNNMKIKQNPQNIMSRFDGSGDISIYLALFEKQISRLDIPKENWVMHLLNLLPLEFVSIISRESDPLADDYNHVKNLLLKRFKLTAEEFRQKFISHRKQPTANWRDFAFELRNYFDEWIQGMDVDNFESLKELIISDRIKQNLPYDIQEHFIDELPNIKNVDELVNKLDDYETARRSFKKVMNRNSNNSESANKRLYLKESDSAKCFSRSQNNNKLRAKNFDPDYGGKAKDKVGIKCFACGSYGHVISQCTNKNNGRQGFRQTFHREENLTPDSRTKREANFSSSIPNYKKMEKEIKINNKNAKCLIDTGSELNLINYETYVKVGSPELLCDDVKLSGIAKEVVQPLGYFSTEFCIDGITIPANVYVIKDLAHEIVLGIDVINKLNLSIDDNGIKVSGKRENAWIGYIKVANELENEDKKTSRVQDSENKNVFQISGLLAQQYPRNEIKPNINANVEISVIKPDISCVNDFNKINKDLNENLFSTVNIRKENENKSLPEISFLINLAEAVNSEEVDLSHLTNLSYKEEIKKLIKDYMPRKTKSTELKMSIILSDDIPVKERPRRFPLKEQKIIEDQIQKWLHDGIIRPSYSDYAAPVVLCKKKDNSYRLCVDYRKLNRKIIKDRFPLPLIEDVLDHLEKSKVFTTLDLKNGFFHVEIEEKSRKYTAFVTHNGEYEFLRCPFGLSTSPSQFQRYINTVFRELLQNNTVVIYMDDIIIPSQDEKEGIEKLKKVLTVASEYGLDINFKKCQFLKRKVEFLGYIIEDGTIRPSPNKTLAVRRFPQPKSVKQVQSYLGLSGYFRKFIPQYAQIARPLSDLLRKGSTFRFGPEQEAAFNKLKDMLSQEPVLHLFKQGYPLELHTDASSRGFGAVLLQKGDDENFHPIQYMSKKTTPQQEKYCSYELEVLAIIEALKKFRNYLLGSKFKIVTDCAAFQKTLNKKELAPRVARWVLFLEDFDYEVEHRPADRMKHVDALSRNTVLIVTRSLDEVTTRIAISQEQDDHIKTIKTLVEKGEENGFFLKMNVLYKWENGRELLVVPEEMQNEVIRKIHNRGHFAVSKTEELVKQEFYIPKLRKQVEIIIANCVDCILHNKKRGKAEGFLNPIPKENLPLSTYHIDHVGPLPSTNKNYKYIFTVTDAFTKFTWFYPVKTTSAKEVIEKLKLQQVVFGNPSRIITDRGSAFTSKDFEEYCTEQGIEHIKITTGLPRGNGQVERIHGILIPVLSKLSKDDSSKWFKYIADVQRVINSSTSRSTKFTPFELLTGVKMKNKEDLRIKEILDDEYINYIMKEREDMREEARKNIMRIQEENRKQFNKSRKNPKKYEIGDIVAIQRTQFGSGLKLKENYHGPYRVSAVRPNDRYDVEKIGVHEGPNKTSSVAEYMKPWTSDCVK